MARGSRHTRQESRNHSVHSISHFPTHGISGCLQFGPGEGIREKCARTISRKVKSRTSHIIGLSPQSNGLTERFNRTLKDTLIKVCSDEQDDWDDFIEEAMFAYRSGKQKSTQEAPFEIMYGRLPVHVMDSEIPIPSQEEDQARANQHLSNLRQNILISTKENIEKSQSQQKKRYKKTA